MKTLYVTIAVTVLYVVLGVLSHSVAILPSYISPLWPPSGVALAAVLFWHKKAWLGIFLGALLVNTYAYSEVETMSEVVVLFVTNMAVGAGALAQAILGWWIIKVKTPKIAFSNSPVGFVFFCLMIPVVCVVSSSIGTSSLYISGAITLDRSSEVWTTWWLGDSLGVLLFTPLFITATRYKLNIGKHIEFGLFMSLLMVVTLFGFGFFFEASDSHYPMAFVSMPILLLLAFRCGSFETMLGLLLMSLIAISMTFSGYGPFAFDDINTSLMVLQAFIAVNVITSMIISNLVNQQKLTEKALISENLKRAQSEARFEALWHSLEDQVEQRTKELEDAKNSAEQLARTDPLTGLNNRRAFNKDFDAVQKVAKRYNHRLALLVLDVDSFKIVNDSHGHNAGDQVVKAVADTILETARESDLSARFGGDEFVVALPETDLEEAKKFSERLRHNIALKSFEVEGRNIRFTVSIGLTISNPGENASIGQIFSRADKALYKAKNDGRNQVAVG